MDIPDIRLIQSGIWSKHNDGNLPPNSNSDQRMHMDYPNNYLTHPQDWNSPESVAIIIYYSDSAKCAGYTKLVPKYKETDHLYEPPYIHNIGLVADNWNNDR